MHGTVYTVSVYVFKNCQVPPVSLGTVAAFRRVKDAIQYAKLLGFKSVETDSEQIEWKGRMKDKDDVMYCFVGEYFILL